jgi:DNA primase
MPGIDFGALRERISIEDVLRLLGFHALHGTGDWVRGRCPFYCSDNSRAFAVNLATNRYYCHHCDRHGNQLELWCEIQGLPLFDGAKDLCEQLHISPPLIHRW